MKNFDDKRRARAERDRAFQIGGHTFVQLVGVSPEVLADYDRIDQANTPTDVIDDVILQMIEDNDGAHERWRELRRQTEDGLGPITLQDMTDLVEWLIEEQTGRRPTQQPSPSTGGPPATATPSTAGSS
jgi:hypothetical protein